MLAGVAKVLMTTRPTQTSVLESLEECRRLGDEAFLEKYATGHQPLGHYLIHEDKRYPMKAVWAAAHRHSHARFQDRRSTKGVEGIGLYKIFAREKFKVDGVRHLKSPVSPSIQYHNAAFGSTREVKPRVVDQNENPACV
jgi:hypothetical protein